MLTALHSMSASSMSSVAEAVFPGDGSPRQRLSFVLKYAALAPLETNWQPWTFQLGASQLELFANADPAREMTDPDGREALIGCGAALHHLKLALKHFGNLGRVELFPDLAEPTLAARIHLGFGRTQEAQENILFAALTRRPPAASLGELPVSETMLTAINHAVATERGWLDFLQSETSRQRVAEIAFASAPRAMGHDRDRSFGMNPSALGMNSRDFAFDHRPIYSQSITAAPPRTLAISGATIAVIKTKTDDKHGWLAAGQTLARAVLQAQALGLAWAFVNPVRHRETREALRMGIGHKGFAQVILRFGAVTPTDAVRVNAPTTATATFR